MKLIQTAKERTHYSRAGEQASKKTLRGRSPCRHFARVPNIEKLAVSSGLSLSLPFSPFCSIIFTTCTIGISRASCADLYMRLGIPSTPHDGLACTFISALLTVAHPTLLKLMQSRCKSTHFNYTSLLLIREKPPHQAYELLLLIHVVLHNLLTSAPSSTFLPDPHLLPVSPTQTI